uniref:GST N-terminal domain-containing protein n=1 Tax=Bionectria ochroleuca TaxID=29856 RepID=A0A8H7KA78_BIOOC
MATPLELFVLPWGVYPRRILLYLSEKGLIESPLIKITAVSFTLEGKMVAEGMPAGTVPVLKLPDGSFIRQSGAILQYFEELCDHPEADQPWQAELASLADKTSMLGNSTAERARIRDMISLTEEACSYFGLACHKGSKLFEKFEKTSALASKLTLEYCIKDLKLLDAYYAEQKSLGEGRDVNIPDLMLFSVLHFSKDLYGLDLCANAEAANLQRFYDNFSKRKSAEVKEGHFPDAIMALASQWLPLD